MDVEITPAPTEQERRTILAALHAADRVPDAYASAWRAAALEDLGDDALAQESGRDARVVEP